VTNINCNGPSFVESTPTEIGDIHRPSALGIQLGDKGIAVRSSGRAFLGLHAVCRCGEVKRRSRARHVHLARGVHSDAVRKVVSLPAQMHSCPVGAILCRRHYRATATAQEGSVTRDGISCEQEHPGEAARVVTDEHSSTQDHSEQLELSPRDD